MANIIGTASSDTLIGTASDDTIQGLGGNDSLSGLGGNDQVLGGDGNDTISGGDGSDSLFGDAGNDTINPGLGYSDSVLGGDGNDLLILNYSIGDTGTGMYFNTNDAAYRNKSDNTDFLDFVKLEGDIERIQVIGTSKDDNIFGTNGDDTINTGAGNDTIAADNGNNIITGGDGDDYISSGEGNDSLIGGNGNDTLLAGTGNDTISDTGGVDYLQIDWSNQISNITIDGYTNGIQLGATLIASNFEGFDIRTGTGNDLIKLSGLLAGAVYRVNDQIVTGAGNDTINPGLGINDTVVAGDGDDLLILDYSIGDTGGGIYFDTNSNAYRNDINNNNVIDYVNLSGDIERVQVTGTSKDDTVFGTNGDDTINTGAGNDSITAFDGNNILAAGDGNDYLSGGTGNDYLSGGNGNDTLLAGTGNDTISDTGGVDYLQIDWSNITDNIIIDGYTNGIKLGQTIIASNFERFNIQTGSGNDSIKLSGLLAGAVHRVNDQINTGGGNDTINPGLGNDTVVAGDGNDLLIIDYSIGDTGTGMFCDSNNYAYRYTNNNNTDYLDYINLANDIERVQVIGTSKNDTIFGTNAGDTLNGGQGNDSLVGGNGNDVYVVDSLNDIIEETSNTDQDVIQSSITLNLSNYTNIENLTLIGTTNINATGSAANNIINGNTGNNRLFGGAGIDTLIGGSGNDTYVLDTTVDTIIETANAGIDTIESEFSRSLANFANVENLTLTGINNRNGTGNTLNNLLIGNSGNNQLDGGAGIDTLVGGQGNDTYIVDTTTDTITEAANGGTDIIAASVTFNLAPIANVENLYLTGSDNINGTGNTLNNQITGNIGNNRYDGGAGIDTLVGGQGNDTYIVDTTTDTITEAANGGTDIIAASVTFNLAPIANVENLYLNGTSNINGIGNTLNNQITGNIGNNRLDGGAGIDTLNGGLGNDRYVVDTNTDLIIEAANGGTDIIESSVTRNISSLANVENVTLTGSNNINAIGNTGNNVLNGNSGNNQLNGGAGVDTLTGGAGNDIYVFQFGQSLVSAPDRVTDFAFGSDKIDLLSIAGVALAAPSSLTRAIDSTATSLTNLVNQVFTDANGATAGNQALGVNSAALARVTSGAIVGTYLIINDATAGFQSNLDSVVNLTGYTGTLPNLGNIAVNTMFV